MIIEQGYLFIIFTMIGIIIGLLFDLFRILRITFKTSNIVTYIEDIIFWILTGAIILYTTFTFNNGEIRLFMFFRHIDRCFNIYAFYKFIYNKDKCSYYKFFKENNY